MIRMARFSCWRLLVISTGALLLWAGPAGSQSLSSSSVPLTDQVPIGPTSGPSAMSIAPEPRLRDELQLDQPVSLDVFGRPLILRLGYENELQRRHDFDLDRRVERDRITFDQELKLDARYEASERVSYFAQIVAIHDWRRDRRDGAVQRSGSLERGEAWVLVDRIADSSWALQAGRIPLVEPRTWWWDQDLDAIRLSGPFGPIRLDTGLARELAPESFDASEIDPAVQDITRWFARLRYSWASRHELSAFWLTSSDHSGVPLRGATFTEDSEDESDFSGRWLGLRAQGEFRPDGGHRVSYRLDAALVRGNETLSDFVDDNSGGLVADDSRSTRVRGSAWDAGVNWRLPGDRRPTVSIGLANGSGGQDGQDVDRNFRQTGLHENKGRVGGVKRLQYYGELLSPDLSNLRIVSLGFGLRVMNNSSVELLLHDYRQNTASSRLFGTRLSADPSGESRDIGREIDIVMAVREWRHAEMRLVVAKFWPGSAFDAANKDPADLFQIEFAISF